MSSTTFEDIISSNYSQFELDEATFTQTRAAFDSPEFDALASDTALELIADLAIMHGVPIALPRQVRPANPGRSFLRTITANLRNALS